MRQRSDKYPFRRSSVQRRQRRLHFVSVAHANMPVMPPDWFAELTGFRETSYDATGHELHAGTSPPRNRVGWSTSGWKALAVCLVLRTLWSRISGTKGRGGERCQGDDALRPLAQHPRATEPITT